jgi:hypothetical protein
MEARLLVRFAECGAGCCQRTEALVGRTHLRVSGPERDTDVDRPDAVPIRCIDRIGRGPNDVPGANVRYNGGPEIHDEQRQCSRRLAWSLLVGFGQPIKDLFVNKQMD